MTSSDNELRKMLEGEGFSPSEIEEALQGRKDLLGVEQIRQMASKSRFDPDDVDGAISTIVAHGTMLPKFGGKRLFTHGDWAKILDEIFERKMRRLQQDPTLVAVSEAVGNSMGAKVEGADPETLAEAQERLNAAITHSLRHGAHISDIADTALLSADAVRKIRDERI